MRGLACENCPYYPTTLAVRLMKRVAEIAQNKFSIWVEFLLTRGGKKDTITFTILPLCRIFLLSVHNGPIRL